MQDTHEIHILGTNYLTLLLQNSSFVTFKYISILHIEKEDILKCILSDILLISQVIATILSEVILPNTHSLNILQIEGIV